VTLVVFLTRVIETVLNATEKHLSGLTARNSSECGSCRISSSG